ncbi:hypothetical protein FFLO_00026 [Filobasidium floriforme]|uniref:H+/nucleoside cotransporter n=1 Tax=Filobasidium floriforme TaxID=5210 RepID=A0A8K0JSZ4_9TREE|nr:Na+ dependent nucleoside transporter C-terminus-domain-containing protein [Filobasidium floriforme]KAG7580055.1 hypothetical protein FFLO_00026 [Filobasidium floriforme]KAH8090711.1 Na+ dependent nucleoside transporter C-terminus-domain-containing protein [Filobasidium floriforme]
MERAHQAQSHDLPISVPTPLVETTDVGNQEGKALASGSLRSEDEKHPYNNEAYVTDLEASRSPSEEQDKDQDSGGSLMNRFKSFRRSRAARVIWDFAWIALLLGWWIPGIIREETRHYWIITTVFTWFFILLILFHNNKYISQKPFIRIIESTWGLVFEKPWNMMSHKVKLIVSWVALLALYLGSAFGIPPTEKSPYKWRAVGLCGMVLLYGGIYLTSTNRSAVKARTTILGLGFQMILGLFVFKTDAGLDLFTWVALACADFLRQGALGGGTFFWRSIIDNGDFATNTLSSIIFFVAFATALYYSGVMSWVLKKFGWLFYKSFGLSGAESIVAAASPFIGQGENCILVKPYVKDMTVSELHQALTSGFATIAGSVFIAYVTLGIPAKDLLTSSLMSIPAAIALSKIAVPETESPKTFGNIEINKGDDEDDSYNLLHSFSNGAWLGLRVAGLIFANVLCVVSALYAFNGLLAWIGQFWGIARSGPNSLSLELIFGYILYPLTFMLGVPPADVLQVSKLIATKIIANEFVAFESLATQTKNDPTWISGRAQLIASYALCGFGNLASGGISIGILAALAPNRMVDIVRLAPRALVTGIVATLSTACIAGLLGDQ